MKKLTASLVLALAVSLAMSSAASAAMLKSKSAQKPATAASEKASQEKSGDTKPTAPTADKTVTLMKKSYVEIGKKIPQAVDDKNGTESIVITNVIAVKKEKITLVYSLYGAADKATPHNVEATIYEMPIGGQVITTSANETGKAYTETAVFMPENDGKTYTFTVKGNLKIGTTTTTDGDANGSLVCIGVVDGVGAYEGWLTEGNPIFIRIVPAQ